MYCWANAPSCSLKILVDKQDNASVPIKNNPRVSVTLFVRDTIVTQLDDASI